MRTTFIPTKKWKVKTVKGMGLSKKYLEVAFGSGEQLNLLIHQVDTKVAHVALDKNAAIQFRTLLTQFIHTEE